MKRTICMLLVVMMVVAMVFAVDAATLGSITISGVSAENIYSIYKLLDLADDGYDPATGAYSYTVNAAWTGFFATVEAQQYMIVDSAGYATWVGAETAERVAAFAELALAYAEAHSIPYVATSEGNPGFVTVVDGVNVGKFENLTLGYYLIDSTMGSLCGLTTTNPDAKVSAKNHAPSIDKQVQEDSTMHWGGSNTASIGDSINFRVSIKVAAGAQNYVLHDDMTIGLTFQPASVAVTLNGAAVAASNYTIDTAPVDNHTFDLVFNSDFCDTLVDGDNLMVTYSAILNENAKIGDTPDTNKAKLQFGDGSHFTTEDVVETYTYGIEIIKSDNGGKLLDGAEFKIYTAATGGAEIPVVKETDGLGNAYYRLAMEGEIGETIEVTDGRIKVVGFDNGTYYLEETKSPAGYNQLTARQGFTVNNSNMYATFISGEYYPGTGVQVVNKTGSILPSTGGMGTVLFITIGTLVVLGAGVLLVTKKRMSMIEE